MAKRPSPKLLKGAPLAYPESLGQKYRAELEALVKRMAKDVRQELTALFRTDTATEYFAQDDITAIQARMLLNLLTKRHEEQFAKHASLPAKHMLDRTN